MSVTSTLLSVTGTSREALALAGVQDALSWRLVLEMGPEGFTRPDQRSMIYADFLTKLGLVLSTTNLGKDSNEELWLIYQDILNLQDTWQDSCRPMLLPEGDSRPQQWIETSGKSDKWIATEKSIAVAGHHRVFEDGPELTPRGSPEGSSGHRGDYSDSEMYAADVFDEEGHRMLARASMTIEQAI
jgi:hypothetical protein